MEMIKDPKGLISEERIKGPNIHVLVGYVIKEAEETAVTC